MWPEEFEYVVIEAIIVKQWEEAILLEYNGEEEWIPYSLIEDAEDVQNEAEGDTIQIGVADFKLEEIGWL